MTTLCLSPADTGVAADLLRASELVIFPTETVYGLGASADDDAAVRKVFEVKGRPADNPLIVHVSDIEMAGRYAEELRDIELCLLEAFTPGPLTLVLKRRAGRAEAAVAGHATIALRIPRSPIARNLITELNAGIAAPSANRSGRPSPTTFDMAWQEMDGRVAAIIKGPPCELGLESTVLYCGAGGGVGGGGEPLSILRPGSVSREMIRQAVKAGGFRQAAEQLVAGGHIPSPGTKYRHYAPRTPISLYETGAELRLLLEGAGAGEVLILPANLAQIVSGAPAGVYVIEVAGADDYARRLYRLFHEIDARLEEGGGRIIAWLPPAGGETEALRDRLQRAACS